MTAFKNLLNRFARDDKGLALTEFAIAMPFLFAAWLGVCTLVDGETVSTRTSRSVSTVVDIITQAAVVNNERANTAFKAVDALMGPAMGADVNLYVVGLDIDSTGKAKVVWSVAKKGVKPAIGSVYPVPVSLRNRAAGQFLVAAKGSYKHSPIFGKNLIGDLTYDYEHFFAPRHSDTIEWKPGA